MIEWVSQWVRRLPFIYTGDEVYNFIIFGWQIVIIILTKRDNAETLWRKNFKAVIFVEYNWSYDSLCSYSCFTKTVQVRRLSCKTSYYAHLLISSFHLDLYPSTTVRDIKKVDNRRMVDLMKRITCKIIGLKTYLIDCNHFGCSWISCNIGTG